MLLRDFRYADLAPVIELYAGVPADDHRRAGLDPEAAVRQVQAFARGRMIPVRVLTALMGLRLGIMVAEDAGRIVGVGGFFGPPTRIGLGPVLVLPDCRERGIGKALTQALMARMESAGGRLVVADLDQPNTIAIHILQSCGFEAYDRYVEYELALPLPAARDVGAFELAHPAAQHRPSLQTLEQETRNAVVLQVEGSLMPRLYPSQASRILDRVYRRFNGRQSLDRVCLRDGKIVGLVRAMSEITFTKGWVTHLLMSQPAAPGVLDVLLSGASVWMHSLRKTALRVRLPDGVQLPSALQPNTMAEEARVAFKKQLG